MSNSIGFDKAALAAIKVGDQVAVKSHNPPNLGCAYFLMTVVWVDGGSAGIALEGSAAASNMVDLETGQLFGQPHRFIEPIGPEVLSANERAQITNWAFHRAERDLCRLPYEVQSEIYHLVQKHLASVEGS